MRWILFVIVAAVLITKLINVRKTEVQKMNEEIAEMHDTLNRSLGVQ